MHDISGSPYKTLKIEGKLHFYYNTFTKCGKVC